MKNLGWIAAAVLGGLLLAKSASASGGGGGLFGGGGGGKGGGGGSKPKPKKGPGGSTVWGTPPGNTLPEGFDPGGNGLYIDPECDFVIEGNLFWPTGSQATCIEAESLEQTLAADPENNVCGFLDYLLGTEGLQQPEDIAWRILEEASPWCASADPSMWGLGLQAWYESFVERVVAYVDEYGGIDFGGDE